MTIWQFPTQLQKLLIPGLFRFLTFQDFLGLETLDFLAFKPSRFLDYFKVASLDFYSFSSLVLQDYWLSRISDLDFLQYLFIKDSIPNSDQRIEIVKITWTRDKRDHFDRHEWMNTVSHFEIFKILRRFRIEASLKYFFVFCLSFSRLT